MKKSATTSEGVTTSNRLIAVLPLQSRQQLLARCERIELTVGDIIYEPDTAIRYIYFPLNCFISLITALNNGSHLEVGIIGDEGMLGAPLVLGVGVSSQQALVQGAGAALRMDSVLFRKHYKQDEPLQQALSRYIHVLMSQLAQTAACTRFHRVEARLARRLLMVRDRAHSDRFQVTHELLAYLLGVRRVGITQAAGSLHARGLINYHRGEIIILNVVGLKTSACECYREANTMYEFALGAQRKILPNHAAGQL